MTTPIQVNDDMSAKVLLRVARGFMLVLWGVMSGLLMVGRVIRIQPLEVASLPLHAVGCGLGAAAVATLASRRNGPLRSTPRLWIPTLLNIYFLPLIAWWAAAPYSDHLLMNVYLAMVSAAWFLIEICRHAARVARVLGDVEFATEARWSTRIGSVVAASSLAWLMGWAVIRSASGETSLYGAWYEALRYLPWWIRMPALTPFPLALMCAWRANRLCVRRVADAGAPGQR